MTSPAADDTLARVLAALVLEHGGRYRRPRARFLAEVVRRLPPDHPVARYPSTAEAACFAVRDHLADTYGVGLQNAVSRNGTADCLRVRLLRHHCNARKEPTNG